MTNYKVQRTLDDLSFERKEALHKTVEAISNFTAICERYCEGDDVKSEMMEAYKAKNQASNDLRDIKNKIAEYRAKIKG